MAEQIKVWRASRNASAGITVRENSVQIVGGSKSAIEVNQTGITLVSKSISMGTSSANIRTGGMFTMMDDFVLMIPPTIVTPMPQRIPFPPLGFVMGLVPILPIFLAVFAASQVGD